MAVEKLGAKIVVLCVLFCECLYLGFWFCLWKLEDNLFFKVSNLGKHNLFWGFDPNYERVFPCGLNDPLVSWFAFDQVQANTLVFVLFHLRCVRQIMVIRKLEFEIRIVIFFSFFLFLVKNYYRVLIIWISVFLLLLSLLNMFFLFTIRICSWFMNLENLVELLIPCVCIFIHIFFLFGKLHS